MKIKITIGGKIFIAALADGKTATAFKKQLPLTIKMFELNRNEKYGELSKEIPTDASIPDKIEIGDIMLYGNQTLVLFYKSFQTSYNYTRIGKIEDTNGLYEALGSGNITITIE